tara:strand:+ start:52 stop:270 length:219 start_codon:yes stop_codon:yes gene_type:complete
MIECKICNGTIKDISFIDTSKLKLCKMCKEEEKILYEWRCERAKERKISKGIALSNNKILDNDVIHHILVFL